MSIQRALLGMVYSSIRGVAIGFISPETLIIKCYLDREPTDFDYENLSDIAAEVLADFEFFNKSEEYCEFTLKPFSKLDSLNSWVYIRQEPYVE